ncbi:Ig-like domain-containing protein, partial [Buttiauxella gaviniae]|uniref:Ig-like domain-containing protein n=1 Tax=Buttiauxella gaviniae TaxID=82990 RepID=UPI00397640B3
MAGLQLFTPVALSAASVARLNTTELTAASGYQLHVLQPGETVWDVASRYGMTPDELRPLNTGLLAGRSMDALKPGDRLYVPATDRQGTPVSAVAPAAPRTDARDAQLATHLATAAGLAQADNSSKAAQSLAQGMATSAVTSAVGEWLSQFGTARVGLNLNDKLHADGSSFDMLLPLYDSEQAMLFTQFGLRNQDDRNTVNLGAGVRTFHQDWMYGGNVFFDNDLTGKNRRVGLGAEAWTNNLKLSGNYYFGLTDWHQSRDFADYDERPANGYDLRAEAYLPAYPQLGGTLMYEKYFGNEVALSSTSDRLKNPQALSAGVNWTPFPLMTVGAQHRAVSGGQDDSQMNVTFTVRPGETLSRHLDPSAVAASRTLAGSRADLVERNNNIVLDYRKQALMKLTLPAAVSGSAGSAVTVQGVVKSKYPLQSVDWQAPQLVADGGVLTVTSPDTLSVTLPGKVNGLPYVLSGVARDERGNVSAREVTHITVTGVDVVEATDHQKTVVPASLPADGRATSLVTLVLQDKEQQPITGMAGELKLTATFTPAVTPFMTRMASRMMAVLSRVNDEPVVSPYRESAPGIYEATLTTGSTPGEVTLVTTFRGVTLRTTAVTITSPDNSGEAGIRSGHLEVVDNHAVADGQAKNSVRVTVTDADGQPLPDQVVSLSATNGAVAGHIAPTDENGQTVVAFSSLKAGISAVTARINNSSQSVDLIFVTGVGIPGTAVVANDNAEANGSDKITITFPVTDANGNPAAGQTVDIVITRPDGTKDTETVTVDADGNATVEITGSVPGTVTVEASAGGSTGSVDANFTADSSQASIAAGHLMVVDNHAVADGRATNRVKTLVTDKAGKPLSNIRVGFTAGNGATIAASEATDAQGEVQMPVTNTRAGVSVITASVNGSSQSVDVIFRAGPGRPGTAVVTGDNASANGTDTITVTFPVTDANGNPAAGQTVEIVITRPDGTKDTQTVTTDAGGNATVDVSGTVAGSVTVEASGDGHSESVNVSLVADAASAGIAAGDLVVVNNNAVADGTATNRVRAAVKDAKGNPVANQTVTFTATHGAKVGTANRTDAHGHTTVSLTSSTAGLSTVTADVNGSTQSVDVNFVAGQGGPGTPVVTDDNAIANGTDTITVTFPVTDANGNPSVGQTVDIVITRPDGTTDSQTVTVDNNGNATVDISSDIAGGVTVEATTGGSSSSVDVNFTADASTATIHTGDLVLVIDNAVANGISTNRVRATVKDAKGNPVANQTVTFTATHGTTVGTVVQTNALGQTKVNLTSTTAGLSTVTAEVNGSSQSVDVNFIADAGSSTIADGDLVVVTNDAVANGTATNSVRVTVKDAHGNPVANQTVTLSANNGAITGTVNPTDADGQTTVTLTSTKAGTSTVSASLEGTHRIAARTVDVNFIADQTTATLAAGDLVVIDDNALADNTDTNRVRARVTDAHGNVLAGQAVSFSGTDMTLTPDSTQTDANGEMTARLTSHLAGARAVQATVNGTTRTVNLTFMANDGTATILDGDLEVVDNNALADGVETSSVRVTVTDENGNVVPNVGVNFSADAPGVIGSTGTTDTAGQIAMTVTSTKAGDTRVTASINGTHRHVNVTFTADSATASIEDGNLTVIDNNAVANGTDINSVQATVTDANGNPVANQTVSFTANNGATVGTASQT